MQRPTFFEHGGYRFLKHAGLIVAGALAIVLLEGSGHYGGTLAGYLLGCVAAALVAVLAWYGVRKRRSPRRRRASDGSERRGGEPRADADAQCRPAAGSLQGWLSAHVYLGLAVVIVAAAHSGFRVGWNVHSLAFLLLLLVAASGCYGGIAYVHLPRKITENIGEDSLRGLLLRIDELDAIAHARASTLPAAVQALVTAAATQTPIGGSLFAQLRMKPRECATAAAVERFSDIAKDLIDGDQPQQLRDLYVILLRRQRLVERVRTDIALNARMRVWLHVHTPLTFALVAALLAHVATILVFW